MPYLTHRGPDHDESLVVRLAADDLAGREADETRRLVATCPACAELLDDIRAISAATAVLPVPRRTRDFRLSDADAARLRPGGWRGWLARFGGQGDALTKPLATGLAALGVAGLLLATVPGGLTGFSSGSAAESRTSNAVGAPVTDQAGGGAASGGPGDVLASMAPLGPTVVGPEAGLGTNPSPSLVAPAKGAVLPDASAAASAAAVPAPAASDSRDGSGGAGNLASGGSGTGTFAAESTPHEGPIPTPSPLVLVSLVLLAAGAGLGLLRWAGRRVG